MERINRALLLAAAIALLATTFISCAPSSYKLSTSCNPEAGGTISPSEGTYDKGLIVYVTATPAAGYRFDHWEGSASGESPRVRLTMDRSKKLTAYFTKTYTVSVSPTPSDGGSISPNGGTYDEGKEVTLAATPAQYYKFNGWSGDASGTSDHVTITMDSNKTVFATFVKLTYSVQIQVDASGGGTVDPGSGIFEAGTVVRTTATPASGYRFDHWGGSATGYGNPLNLLVDADKTVIAYFTALPPTDITGTVFLDQNGDGIKDASETGVASVVVSNGLTTTTTGATGGYTLPIEGDFVFLTVPNTYAASGPWYRSVSGTQFDFGLKAAPEKSGDDFTFIHMTDIHLDAANLVTFNKAVEEFKTISPAFVVSTGDLVNAGDAPTSITISEAQATEWFGAYITATNGLSMPVYNVMGNHDAANLPCEGAAGATAGCSKNVWRNNFGPTYYSFDWGQYHCVVLDPNGVAAGLESFSITGSQWAWLQADLGYRAKSSPLLVFCHEPTSGWKSQTTVLNLLKEYKTKIFSGGAHEDLLMDSSGVPEQVTAALSGEWGYGDNLDGRKPGYRIVSVTGSVLDDFYKEIDSSQQIEISPAGATWPIVSGQVELVAKIFTGSGTVSEVTHAVDNTTAVAMTLTTGAKWVTAKATWDTGSLSQDYHRVTVIATGSAGTSQVEEEVKVSTETALTAADLQAHLKTYQGHYVTVQGTVEMALFNTSFAPEGAGGAVIVDATGKTLIYAGQCYSPALPTVVQGSTIKVKVIPLRFTWAFLTSTSDREGTFEMFTMQESMVPAGQKEDSGGTKVARWYMRLVRASDITIL